MNSVIDMHLLEESLSTPEMNGSGTRVIGKGERKTTRIHDLQKFLEPEMDLNNAKARKALIEKVNEVAICCCRGRILKLGVNSRAKNAWFQLRVSRIERKMF